MEGDGDLVRSERWGVREQMEVDFGSEENKRKNLGREKKAQVLGRVFKTRLKPSFLKTRIYLSKTGPKTWAKAPF